jgi:hypothetical protein
MPGLTEEQVRIFDLLKKEAFTFEFRPLGEAGEPVGPPEICLGFWKDIENLSLPSIDPKAELFAGFSLSKLRDVLKLTIPGAEVSEDDLWTVKVEGCMNGGFARFSCLSLGAQDILHSRIPRTIIFDDFKIQELFLLLVEKREILMSRIDEIFPGNCGYLSENEFSILEKSYPQLKPIIEIFKGDQAIQIEECRSTSASLKTGTKLEATMPVYIIIEANEALNQMQLWNQALYSGLLNLHEVIVDGNPANPKQAYFSGDLRKLAHPDLEVLED